MRRLSVNGSGNKPKAFLITFLPEKARLIAGKAARYAQPRLSPRTHAP